MPNPDSLSLLKELIEPCLLILPEKVQLAFVLIDGEHKHFIGAERTQCGIRYLDNRKAVFEIGSISKVITATLLAQTVEKGNLALETPVQSLLPFPLKQFQLNGVELSLKHLANHTSGIAHHQPPGLMINAILRGQPRLPFRHYTNERFERYLKERLKLTAIPGSVYFYSNLGMSLAGYALAQFSGQCYDEMVKAHIFTPLGMSLSGMKAADLKAHIIPGWEKAGRSAPNWDFFALSPAGGVKTCAEDFAKFISFHISERSATWLTQQPTFQINPGNAVGLGWHITERSSGECWLNHGGGTLGYSANVLINPAKKTAVAAFSNLNNINNWAKQLFDLCAALLESIEPAKKLFA